MCGDNCLPTSSVEWKHPTSPDQKKIQTSGLSEEILSTHFLENTELSALEHYLETGTTGNSKNYCSSIDCVGSSRLSISNQI